MKRLDLDDALGLRLAAIDRVRGVDDQVREHLLDLADVAVDLGQLAERQLDVGDLTVLVPHDLERRVDRAVEVGQPHLGRVTARELAHRADDPRDRLGAAQDRRHRRVYVGVELGQLGQQLAGAGTAGLLGPAAPGGRQRLDRRQPLGEHGLEHLGIRQDVLGRRVDLVRDAGRELADALELVRQPALVLESRALDHLDTQSIVGAAQLGEHAGRGGVAARELCIRLPDPELEIGRAVGVAAAPPPARDRLASSVEHGAGGERPVEDLPVVAALAGEQPADLVERRIVRGHHHAAHVGIEREELAQRPGPAEQREVDEDGLHARARRELGAHHVDGSIARRRAEHARDRSELPSIGLHVVVQDQDRRRRMSLQVRRGCPDERRGHAWLIGRLGGALRYDRQQMETAAIGQACHPGRAVRGGAAAKL